MKKILLWLLVITISISTIAVFSLTGCKTTKTAETTVEATTAAATETTAAEATVEETTAQEVEITEPVTIKFWCFQTPFNEKIFKAVIEEFKTIEPLVTVNLELIGINDYDQKIKVAIATEEAADAYLLMEAQFQTFFNKDLLAPIDVKAMGYGSVEECVSQRFLPGTIDFAVKDGQLYALWEESANWAVAYNKASFDKAGVPYLSEDKIMTWEEYFELAKSLTLRDENGKMTQMGEGMYISSMDNPDGARYILDPIFRQLGGVPFDEVTGEPLNKDAWIKVAQMMYDASLNGKYGYFDSGFPTGTNAHPEMFTGRVAMVMAGPWAEGWGKSIDPNLKIGFAPYPAVDSTHNEATTGGWVFVVNAKSPTAQQIAASKFLDFVTNDKSTVTWFKDGGIFTPRKVEGLQDIVLELNPSMKIFYNDAPRARLTIYGEFGAERWTVVKKMAEAIFKNGTSPEEAVENAWSELETLK